MSETILVERDGPLLRLVINRPAKKNALTADMYRALNTALIGAATDPEVRAVVISGAGDCFTAGNDLRDFVEAPPTGADAPVVQFLHTLSGFPKVLIAAVHGVAIGIGTTLLLHCDLVVASPGTRFQLPFVDLALVPEAASSLLLPRLIGHQRAAELLLLAEPFDTARAEQFGLINRVVAQEDLLTEAVTLARRIAAKPASAITASKRLLKSETHMVSSRIGEELAAFQRQLQSPDLKAAVAAFFNKGAAS